MLAARLWLTVNAGGEIETLTRAAAGANARFSVFRRTPRFACGDALTPRFSVLMDVANVTPCGACTSTSDSSVGSASLNRSRACLERTPVSEALDSIGLAGATVQLKAVLAELKSGSSAVTVTAYVAAFVGVPVMTPVDALISRPGGRPSAL